MMERPKRTTQYIAYDKSSSHKSKGNRRQKGGEGKKPSLGKESGSKSDLELDESYEKLK